MEFAVPLDKTLLEQPVLELLDRIFIIINDYTLYKCLLKKSHMKYTNGSPH